MRNVKIGDILKNYNRELGIAIGIVLMTITFSSINPIYISWGNIRDIMDQTTIYGFLALGMSFTIISGGIDLSAGAVVALIGVIMAKLLKSGVSVSISISVALLIGVILGSFNGFTVAVLKIQAFIATLATLNIYRGVAYLISGGFPVTNMPRTFRNLVYGDIFGGVRSSIFIFIAAVFVAHLLLKYTKFGNYVYAIGGNAEAANLSGVKCVKNTILAYTVCGIFEAFAAIVLVAKLGTAEATAGNGYELQAIAAVAIGGASMAGGRGTIIGTFLGAILLNGLRIGLIVTGMDPFWQYIATGFVIIVAVYTEIMQSNISKTKKRKTILGIRLK